MGAIDRERIDIAILVFAYLVGIISGMMLKLNVGASMMLEDGEYPVWLPAVTSGIVIVAYAVIAHTSIRARTDPGQTGDNAYYLGFVLTLASLAFTLYQLGSESQNSDRLFRDVIAGFGVALSSTIFGVMVRVFLLQYRVDLVAREREVRLKLNDVMRRFHVEIEDAVRGTKYLGTEIRQSLEEHNHKIAENHGQKFDKLVEEVSTKQQKILEGMVEQAKEVNTGLVSITRNTISNVEKAALETLGTVSTQMRETNVAIKESIRLTSDSLKCNIQEINEVMSGSMSDLRAEARRSIEEISRIQAECVTREGVLTDQATTSIRQVGDFADSARSAISRAEKAMLEALNAFSGQLRDASDAMNEATGSVAEALKLSLQEANAVISADMSDLRAEVRRSAEETSRVHAQGSVHEAVQMDEAAKSMQHAISSPLEEYQASMGEVEKMTDNFENVSDRAHEAMDQVAGNLDRMNEQDSEEASSKRWKILRVFGRSIE